ncbi:MAG: hypothetical protein ACFCU1_10835 [Sumerlaeia bacterium]
MSVFTSRPFILVGSLCLSFLTMGIFLVSCKEEQELFETSSNAANPQIDSASPNAEAGPTAEPTTTGTPANSRPAGPLAPPEDRPRLEAGAVEFQNFGFPGIRMDIPKSWAQKSGSEMRLTQFDSATDENGNTADFIVFYFGPNQGGTAASNLARWGSQVQSNEEPVIYQYMQNDLLISEIMAKGTLLPSNMGAGPTQPMKDYFLYGIIVNGGVQGSVFFKATGPQSLIPTLEPQYTTIVESIKKDPKASEPDLSIPAPNP